MWRRMRWVCRSRFDALDRLSDKSTVCVERCAMGRVGDTQHLLAPGAQVEPAQIGNAMLGDEQANIRPGGAHWPRKMRNNSAVRACRRGQGDDGKPTPR